jgi:hypothetical protein
MEYEKELISLEQAVRMKISERIVYKQVEELLTSPIICTYC